MTVTLSSNINRLFIGHQGETFCTKPSDEFTLFLYSPLCSPFAMSADTEADQTPSAAQLRALATRAPIRPLLMG